MTSPEARQPDPDFQREPLPGDQLGPPAAPSPDGPSTPPADTARPWWQEPQPHRPITFRGVLRFLGEAAVETTKMAARDIANKVHGRPPEPPKSMTKQEVRRWNVENGFPEDWRL